MNKLLLLSMVLSSQVMALDLSALTATSSLGSKVTVKDLPKVIKSNRVYCARIDGKNYLASIGAMKVFKATVTSRTKSVVCNSKVKREALRQGLEVIQLSKSKMDSEAYIKLGKALTNAFGV